MGEAEKCAWCGGAMAGAYRVGRVYCRQLCRRRAWRAATPPYVCRFCKRTFIAPRRSGRTMCSPECRRNAAIEDQTRLNEARIEAGEWAEGVDVIYLAHIFGWDGLFEAEIAEAVRRGVYGVEYCKVGDYA